MPVDPESLAALGDLAARSDRGAPRTARPADAPRTSTVPTEQHDAGSTSRRPVADPLALLHAVDPGTRQRVLALGAGSVLAGLVCGLLVPASAEAQAPGAAASTSRATSSRSAEHPLALTSSSPFAQVGPARPDRLPVTGPASTGIVARARTAVLAASDAEPAALHPRAAVPAVSGWRATRPLPAGSGTGRRIVYAERAAHLWIVGADGRILRDYKVTGRVDRPRPGSYRVYSKSEHTSNPKEKLVFDLMVRFARGYTGAPIGFHTIPRSYSGAPIQSESALGTPVGRGGCVRQTRVDAEWLYSWVQVGDTVVVLR